MLKYLIRKTVYALLVGILTVSSLPFQLVGAEVEERREDGLYFTAASDLQGFVDDFISKSELMVSMIWRNMEANEISADSISVGHPIPVHNEDLEIVTVFFPVFNENGEPITSIYSYYEQGQYYKYTDITSAQKLNNLDWRDEYFLIADEYFNIYAASYSQPFLFKGGDSVPYELSRINDDEFEIITNSHEDALERSIDSRISGDNSVSINAKESLITSDFETIEIIDGIAFESYGGEASIRLDPIESGMILPDFELVGQGANTVMCGAASAICIYDGMGVMSYDSLEELYEDYEDLTGRNLSFGESFDVACFLDLCDYWDIDYNARQGEIDFDDLVEEIEEERAVWIDTIPFNLGDYDDFITHAIVAVGYYYNYYRGADIRQIEFMNPAGANGRGSYEIIDVVSGTDGYFVLNGKYPAGHVSELEER